MLTYLLLLMPGEVGKEVQIPLNAFEILSTLKDEKSNTADA
jgi:hypothetical protein